jgi:hypothetical protein
VGKILLRFGVLLAAALLAPAVEAFGATGGPGGDPDDLWNFHGTSWTPDPEESFRMADLLPSLDFQEDVPKVQAPEVKRKQAHSLQIRLSVEPYAVYTAFQGALRLENSWGFGSDVKVIGDWGRKVCLVLRAGVAGWNTDNASGSLAYPGTTEVRQYRFGVGMDVVGEKSEFGLSLNFGSMRFRTQHVPADFVAGDTAGFFELEATFGVKPAPYLKLGVLGMVTIVTTGFNRPEGHDRNSAIGSIGPSIEFMFAF